MQCCPTPYPDLLAASVTQLYTCSLCSILRIIWSSLLPNPIQSIRCPSWDTGGTAGPSLNVPRGARLRKSGVHGPELLVREACPCNFGKLPTDYSSPRHYTSSTAYVPTTSHAVPPELGVWGDVIRWQKWEFEEFMHYTTQWTRKDGLLLNDVEIGVRVRVIAVSSFESTVRI